MAMIARLSPAPRSRTLLSIRNLLSLVWPSLKKSTHVHADVIDSFTTELVSKNVQKWDALKQNLKIPDNLNSTFTQGIEVVTKGVLDDTDSITTPELGLDIRTLSQPQLDNLLMSTVEIKNKVDFLYLTKQCLQWRVLPSDEVLIETLKYLSSLGQSEQIDRFAEVCRLEMNPVGKKYVNLAPFKGMSLWRNGSSDHAIQTLRNGYLQSAPDAAKRLIRIAFKTISEETLLRKSEAVLNSLRKTAVQIYQEQKDIFVVACVWKNSFLSDWQCDQKSAEGLFEEYADLRNLVHKRAQSLCSSFLKQHNVDAVHRLIELFLRHENLEACRLCLLLLFDYQYYRKDLRACAEIVKSTTELGLQLTDDQNERFLQLFLNQPGMQVTKKPKIRPEKFEYKF